VAEVNRNSGKRAKGIEVLWVRKTTDANRISAIGSRMVNVFLDEADAF
jgi:hypothetical protein